MFNFLNHQMRRSRFLLYAAAIVMSACTEQLVSTDVAVEQGEISVSLVSQDGHQVVVPLSKSVVDTPDANAFEIEIFNSSGVRLYRDSYENTVGKKILLNAGDYRLLAQYGDSLGVGFDVTYFAADQNFTVHGQTSEEVNAVAKMANVKVAVNFGENLRTYYPEHFARVKHPELSDYLQFEKDETRAGYIPAEDLVLEIHVTDEGKQKYWAAPAITCAPNDFVTFNVDIDPRTGDITAGITIDDTVDLVEKEITIPADAASQDAPAITMSGFDDSRTFNFVEGVEYSGVQSDFVVMGGIAQCRLDIKSDYLVALGLPAQVDLVNADESVKKQFEDVGIRWNSGMTGKRIASVDFSGLSSKLAYDPDNVFSATFTVTVTDENGKESVSEEYVLKQVPPVFSLSAAEGNAFARRIEGVTADVTSGNPALLTLEYSTDNSFWTAVPANSVSGTTINYSTLSGLVPETDYYLRTKYNGNDNLVSEVVTLRTETAAQIGNSGFEEWQSQVYEFNVASLWNNKSVTWYQPWGTDKWWDVNSRKAFHSYSALTAAQNLRSFPTVAWSDDAFDGKSAHIFTANTGTASTADVTYADDTTVGELFIGTADDSGNHSSDGHDFPSRPSALSFKYKYSPVSEDAFYVKVEIKAADGSVIVSKEILDGPAASSWSDYRINLEYQDMSRKAASIFISFKSSSAADSSAGYAKNSVVEAAGGDYTGHFGSSLRIDDLQMIYE